jgi:hypothetical protein
MKSVTLNLGVRSFLFALAVNTALFLPAAALHAQPYLFQLVGQKDAYLFEEKSMLLTNGAAFTLKGTSGDVKISTGSGSAYHLEFRAPAGSSLAVRVFTNAVRPMHDDKSTAMEIVGDGRGCNDVCGSFEVREIHFDGNGRVDRFWAVFTNVCECTKPPVVGEIRFNSRLAPKNPLELQPPAKN